MNIEKLKAYHRQMNEATGKVFWELDQLSKIAEPDSELEKWIRAYMRHLETVPPNGYTEDNYMSFIKKANN